MPVKCHNCNAPTASPYWHRPHAKGTRWSQPWCEDCHERWVRHDAQEAVHDKQRHKNNMRDRRQQFKAKVK